MSGIIFEIIYAGWGGRGRAGAKEYFGGGVGVYCSDILGAYITIGAYILLTETQKGQAFNLAH